MRALFRLLIWSIGALWATAIWAGPLGGLEGAVMPGEVIEGHAKYEKQCEKCHSPFSKATQNILCNDCHKEVRADIADKKGFHGRIADAKDKPCKACHTEHKGRKANIVLLDKDTFDHNSTDFQLKGKHKQITCAACHVAKKKFREAQGKCYDCHKDDEPHKGKLGKECDVCHKETGWKEFFFDHSRTEFALKGKHQGVGCKDCHVNERYAGLPRTCVSCHRSDDKHKGQYGEKCDKCHTANGWHSVGFDHDRDTKFKLEGKHVDVTCAQCHKDNLFKVKLKTDCYSCHQLQDEHKGLYGKKCDTCHTLKGWSEIRFNHDKDTKYPLRGKHKDVSCRACHRGDLYKEKLKTECFICHQQDDAHKGQEGTDCKRCHNEEGWSKKVAFDHDITKFPLLGVHSTIGCEECHSTSSFKDAKVQCTSCHNEDDVHKARLGTACETCHTPTNWKVWQFDHDKQTKFRLDGAHKETHCYRCHEKPVVGKIKMEKTCVSCHLKDDAHGGTYGRVCERCHVTNSFKEFTLENRKRP